MPETRREPTTAVRRSRREPDKARRVVTGDRDADLVRFLLRFSAATSAQVRQAFGLSVNGGNRVLRRLFDAQLVRRHASTLTGSVSWQTQPVYTVGPQAAEWAAEWEEIPLDEARRRCRGDRTPTYLAHALSIVDLYLALQSALIKQNHWTLHRFLVERECLDELTLGTGRKERRILVRPDAMTVLRRTSDGALFCLALESDLHNVRARAFAHKVETYLLYSEGGAFLEAYPGSKALYVLTATGSETRIGTLAETVLEAGVGQLFWFTTRPALEKDGFLGPVWRRAGETNTHGLLPFLNGEGGIR